MAESSRYTETNGYREYNGYQNYLAQVWCNMGTVCTEINCTLEWEIDAAVIILHYPYYISILHLNRNISMLFSNIYFICYGPVIYFISHLILVRLDIIIIIDFHFTHVSLDIIITIILFMFH